MCAYAAAGVGHYWVVAPAIPSLTVYRLGKDGAYRETTHVEGGQSATVHAPVELTVAPADLVR